MSCRPRISSSGPTSPSGTSSCRGSPANTRRPSSTPSGSDGPRGGCWASWPATRSSTWVLDGDALDDETVLARPSPPALGATFDDLVAARLGRSAPTSFRPPGWSGILDRLGGWQLAPPVLVEQLATLGGRPRRSCWCPVARAGTSTPSSTSWARWPRWSLHPDDATRPRRSSTAAGVVVRSEPASSRASPRSTPAVRVGTVSVPHGHQRANVNRSPATTTSMRRPGWRTTQGSPSACCRPPPIVADRRRPGTSSRRWSSRLSATAWMTGDRPSRRVLSGARCTVTGTPPSNVGVTHSGGSCANGRGRGVERSRALHRPRPRRAWRVRRDDGPAPGAARDRHRARQETGRCRLPVT